MSQITIHPLPAKPGDWVMGPPENPCVAKVKDICWFDGQVHVDLVFHDWNGHRIGRKSPACGGPRTYEPMVPWQGWHRIRKPVFPILAKWLPNENGSSSLGYDTGLPLPDRSWIRIEKQVREAMTPSSCDLLLTACRAIAAGHNDPRTLAIQTLQAAGLAQKKD